MEWQEIKVMLEGILDRQYYTNHGPLLEQLENTLSELYKIKNVVVILSYGLAKEMVERLSVTDYVNIIQLDGGASAVLTDNDNVSDKLRCMKSSYGIKKIVSLLYSGTGRVSEIQAGLALLGLGVKC